MSKFDECAPKPGDTIHDKAKAIIKELDQDGAEHFKKAADLLREEFASTKLTADEKRQLIIAVRTNEDKGVGADLEIASATLARQRTNPKLKDEMFVQLVSKDRSLGDSIWKGSAEIVGKTAPGMKSFAPISEIENQGMHIAYRMDDGHLHLAADELRAAGKKMTPEQYQELLKVVSREEAKNVGGDLILTAPYVKPKTEAEKIKETYKDVPPEEPKPVVKTYEIYRTPAQTELEKAQYGGATKSAQFEKIAKKTDGLPNFTIVEGDSRLTY
jgi:hypothetical protein